VDKDIENIISSIYGKKKCRVKVGNSRNLSLGFGEKIFHNNPRLNDKYYGEWEIGTYYGCWRIIKDNKILLGSSDTNADIKFLNGRINEIQFREISSIDNFSFFDVRVTFNDGMIIEFIPLYSDEDEFFHIFCPNNIYVEFNSEGLWKSGKSNAPWL
jgi:hypothetical protein